MERYDPVADRWTAVADMGQTKASFGVHGMKPEVNLFDALIAKAEGGGRAR